MYEVLTKKKRWFAGVDSLYISHYYFFIRPKGTNTKILTHTHTHSHLESIIRFYIKYGNGTLLNT